MDEENFIFCCVRDCREICCVPKLSWLSNISCSAFVSKRKSFWLLLALSAFFFSTLKSHQCDIEVSIPATIFQGWKLFWEENGKAFHQIKTTLVLSQRVIHQMLFHNPIPNLINWNRSYFNTLKFQVSNTLIR